MRKRTNNEAWRRLKNVKNPLNQSEVDTDAASHVEFLKSTGIRNPSFTGQMIIKDGECWGKFLIGRRA